MLGHVCLLWCESMSADITGKLPFVNFAAPLPMNIVSVNALTASIKQARKKLGWTQSELAERSGVSRDWIIGLEKGKPSLELGLVLRTLKALDLPLSLGRQGQSAPSDDMINLNDVLNTNTEGTTQS